MASSSIDPAAGIAGVKADAVAGPTVSLVIPVYNRPQLITECLQSLAPALPYLLEVLVVDDGSRDGRTPEAVEAAIAGLEAAGAPAGKVRLIRQQNAGPGAARNTGAQTASGEWIFFLDSDDRWFPWTMPALLAALERNGDAVALFMNTAPFMEIADLAGVEPDPAQEIPFASFFEMASRKPNPALIGSGYFAVRREIFVATGGFVPHLKGSEDTDLFYRIAHSGQFLAITQPVTVARRFSNTDSLTLNMTAVHEGLVFLLDSRREGRYPGRATGELDGALSLLLAFYIHELFWNHHGRQGYDILLARGGFGIMWRQGHRLAALKLLLAPVLSLLKPRNHRFGWRPQGAR